MESKKLILVGLISTVVGLFHMMFLNEKSTFLMIILAVSLVALGSGMFQAPNNALVMSSVKKSKLGIAGSINVLIRNLVFIFGV